MTQNEKELLLKDLCARLPYRVKFEHTDKHTLCEILSITPIYDYGNVIYFDDAINHPKKCSIDDVKPYLFPLSSMTEEHIFEINDILGKDFEIDKYGITDLIRNRRTCLSYLELDALFEYFNKYHFDYRGLIEKGLAIDATNLNIY